MPRPQQQAPPTTPPTHIIEYVGGDGVESSPLSGRLAQPRPGDLIEWADGTLGRIWEVGTGHCEPDQVHVCNSLGSAFLGRGYVSISGGPFTILQLGDLTATRRCALSCFWNWGDNSSGAGMDVEYWLARPVFHVDRLP